VSYLKYSIANHDQWSSDEWERRSLDILEAERVLPSITFNAFRDRFVRHTRHAQELEGGNKSGHAYRVKALEAHAQMMFLVTLREHWKSIEIKAWHGEARGE
jgi:hypothetical protein